MTIINNNPHEEFDAMLKKVQWPTPSLSLEGRILAAVELDAESNVPLSPWVQKNPILSFLSVLLALFIGIGSGALTGPSSQAASLSSPQSPYGDQTHSIHHLYFQDYIN